MTVGSVPRRAGSALLFEPRPPAPPEAVSLLAQARHGLADAGRERTLAARFAASYLSALRAGAAILAAKGRPHRRAAKPQSTWALLASTAPEVAQWAEYFAARSATHASAQAGITRGIDDAMVDDQRRRAEEFVALAHRVVHGPQGESGARTSARAPWCQARPRTRSRRDGK